MGDRRFIPESNTQRRPKAPRGSGDLINGHGSEYLALLQAPEDQAGFQTETGGGIAPQSPTSTTTPTPPPPTTTMPVAQTPVTSAPAPQLSPVDSTPTQPATTPEVPAAPATAPAASDVPPAAPAMPAAASPMPPVASAGSAQVITVDHTTLDGSGSTDSQESPISFQWTLISGPNSPVVDNAATATPAISGLVAGTYLFQLTVTNGMGMNDTAQVAVTVQPAASPVAPAAPVAPADNTNNVDISTAPAGGGGGGGPYGGGGGAGGGGDTDTVGEPASAPASPLAKVGRFLRHNWWWLAVAAIGLVLLDTEEGGGS